MSYNPCSKSLEFRPDSQPPVVNKDQPRSIKAGDYKKLEIPGAEDPMLVLREERFPVY